MESAPPERIGRYRIQQELGRGMMGVVYRALDPALDRLVALKTIQLAFTVSDPDREAFELRFFAEARAAARLSHPGIVVVHDVGRDPETGTLFMALEYLHGRTLAATAPNGLRLPSPEALRIVARVAEALAHAHANGVVHRDIKPANIMMLDSGEPKIMDFGIAKLEAQAHLTTTGQFFGTPLFMSPEQALGQVVDAKSDLFSLGAVAYALLTGRRPFDAENIPRILARIAYEDPPRPSSLEPDLGPDVDYLMARALSKSPDRRYPDGLSFAEDVEDVRSGRAPRHRPGWRAPGAATGSLGAALPEIESLVLDPEALEVEHDAAARATRVTQRLPASVHSSRWRRWLALGAGIVLVGLVGFLFRPGTQPTAPAASSPAATIAVGAVPTRSAAPSGEPSPSGGPARLAIDFEHGLEDGTLSVFIDDESVLTQALGSQVTRSLLGLKLRKGVLQTSLDVTPGKHEVRVRVRWDDNDRAERIWGSFRGGVSYRLEIRLGRIRKNLSLDWK